jgi:Skp family chaperone for outer membrane proteins
MRLLLATILLALAACTKAPIQPAALPPVQPKVAILDIQKAVTSTNEGKAASNDLHRKFDPDIARFDRDRQEIEEMRQRLLNRDFGGDQAATAKEIDARQKRYNRNMEDARQRVEVEQKRILKDLSAKLMLVASDYARQNHFEVVMDSTNILWRADQTDITDKVIELYDLKYR